MDVIGVITAGAAGLAAVLAAVNLYVSGRREQNKWTREALIETIVKFLNASFEHSATCRSLALLDSPSEVRRQRFRVAVVAAHDLEGEAMTRMRLLAPSQLVTTAESLHELEHALAALCFKEPLPATVALDDARLPVRVCRERLLEAARRALRLRDTAPISDKNEASWDEFQYFTQSYGEQAKNSEE